MSYSAAAARLCLDTRSAPLASEVAAPGGAQRTGAAGEESEALLLAHLPQVRLVAEAMHERVRCRVELDDLIGYGVQGLLKAIERFDPSRGVLLKTYAEHRIRGAMLDGLRDTDWLPRHARQKKRLEQEARDESQECPTGFQQTALAPAGKPRRTARAGEMPFMELLYAGAALEELEKISLKAGLRGLLGAAPENPEDAYQRKEMEEQLTQAMLHLPRRHREVLQLYYCQELSMKEIAQILHVHESRISQLHAWALRRLRRSLSGSLVSAPPASPLKNKPRAQSVAASSSKYFRTASQSSSVSTPMVSCAVSAT